MQLRSIKRVFLGQPLSNQRLNEEKLPKWKALAVLSSDALSSVAYATEEILLAFMAFSVAALTWSLPVALAILALMIIVTLSYQQTIRAYPNGGGAYVVARENLGLTPGLIAAAALLIGYVLTVAVSVAAGVNALISAVPDLEHYRVVIGALLILALTLANLRGSRESATIFAFPTYLFILSMVVLIAVGAWKAWSGQLPQAYPVFEPLDHAVPLFLILRAFSSGCAALTGIEAISNSVPSFRSPASKNANITLTWMVIISCVLFFGVTALAHVYGVMPIVKGEAVVSQLARQVFDGGWFYYVIQIATAAILVLAANTCYTGFPWLAAVMAKDRYLPRQFAMLGDKLVFSNAIIGLGIGAAALIVLFGGDTHSLIPLYALGVFIGFTLSQAGMLKHHLINRKNGCKRDFRWFQAFSLNALGMMATAVVSVVVAVTKFSEGAWIVVLVIPLLILVFSRVNKHYMDVGKELSLEGLTPPEKLEPFKHTVVVPISGIHRGVIEALRYAISISHDVRAVYVEIDSRQTERMREQWQEWAPEVPITVLKSPYRSVIRPILEYLDDMKQATHSDMVTVIIPEFVTAKWWHQALHNQTAFVIRAALLFRRNKVVTSVRYHLRST